MFWFSTAKYGIHAGYVGAHVGKLDKIHFGSSMATMLDALELMWGNLTKFISAADGHTRMALLTACCSCFHGLVRPELLLCQLCAQQFVGPMSSADLQPTCSLPII